MGGITARLPVTLHQPAAAYTFAGHRSPWMTFLTFADSADISVAVAGVAISAVVAWMTAKRAVRGDERQAIREGNMRLIELTIQYPFLESSACCDNWPDTSLSEEDCMRYDIYCCHVFNLLQQCYEFCNGNEDQMRTVLYPDELIHNHRRWWRNDEANQMAYPVPFRQFVSTKIRQYEDLLNESTSSLS